MSSSVYLGLGSNLGDRKKNLDLAVEKISQLSDTIIIKRSNIYETDPVGYLEQDKFLNAVVKIETSLKPVELLQSLQNIEYELKRTREIHWGPRTIDIDILLYDQISMDLPELKIPHPRMFEREFVMIPLRDVYDGNKLLGLDFEDHIKRLRIQND